MTCAEAAEAGALEPVLIGCGPGALARRGKGSQRLQWAEVPWRRTRGHYDARALTPGHPRSSVLLSARRTADDRKRGRKTSPSCERPGVRVNISSEARSHPKPTELAVPTATAHTLR